MLRLPPAPRWLLYAAAALLMLAGVAPSSASAQQLVHATPFERSQGSIPGEAVVGGIYRVHPNFCVGTADSLVFYGSGSRYYQTPPRDLRGGGIINFKLKATYFVDHYYQYYYYGCNNLPPQTPLEHFDYYDTIYLQYFDGNNWVTIQSYSPLSNSALYSTGVSYSVEIPIRARRENAMLRIAQLNGFGYASDTWALDDLFLYALDEQPGVVVDDGSGGAGTLQSLTFTEGDPGMTLLQPVGAGFVSVGTLESSTPGVDVEIASMTLEILNLEDEGNEQLGFDEGLLPSGVTATTENNGAVIRVEGLASAEDYSIVLRAIEYRNISGNPTNGTRQVGIIVNDADGRSSRVFSVFFDVIAVNTPPGIIAPGALAVSELVPITFDPGFGRVLQVVDVDAGNATIFVDIVALGGDLSFPVISGAVQVTDDFNNVLSPGDSAGEAAHLEGTVTDINATLLAMTYVAKAGTSVTTIEIDVDDDGASGLPNGDTKASHTINITSAPGPDVAVIPDDGLFVEVANNGTYTMDVNAGHPASRLFRVVNNGSQSLTLRGTPVVSVISTDNVAVAYDVAVDTTTVASAGTTIFGLRIVGQIPSRTFTAVMQILTNDPDESAYTFTVTGRVFTAPRIEVSHGGRILSHNDRLYGGETAVNTARSVGLMVKNTGSSDLFLGTSPVDLVDPNILLITPGSPLLPVVPAGVTTIVPFDIVAPLVGEYEATLELVSNDPSEPAFRFRVAITCSENPEPALRVTRSDGVSIDRYDSIGRLPLNAPVTLTWTLANVGAVPLVLEYPVLDAAAASNLDTRITPIPSRTLPPNRSTELRIQLTGRTTGAFSVSIRLRSNDPTTPSRLLTVRGTVVAVTSSLGEIEVWDESDWAWESGSTHILPGLPITQERRVTYTIVNRGSAPLSLGSIQLTDLDNCTARLFRAPTGSVPAYGETEIELMMQPRTAGAHGLQVVIPSNDLDEPIYTIELRSGGDVGSLQVSAADGSWIAPGGTKAFLSAFTGTDTVETEVTLTNAGSQIVTLAGTPTVTVDGATGLVVDGPALTTLLAGESTTMTIAFDPTVLAGGEVTLTIEVLSSDPMQPTYEATITYGREVEASDTDSGCTYQLRGANPAWLLFLLLMLLAGTVIRNRADAA